MPTTYTKADAEANGVLKTVLTKWQTVLAIDFNEPACAAHHLNFPETPVICGKVEDHLDQIPSNVGILHGGPPCQDFSTAGEGLGENGERDGFPAFIAAVRKSHPRHILAENVKGLITERHWPYFCRIVRALEEIGYSISWKLIDAVSAGVPQFRERVWVWGIRLDLIRNGMRHVWPEPTHQWPPPEGCMFGKALLPGVTVGEALGLDGWIHKPRSAKVIRRDHPTSEPCPTIEARAALGGGSCMTIKTHRGPEWAKLEAERMIDEPAPAVTAGSRSGGHDGLYLQSHADPAVTIDQPATTLRSGGAGHDGCCLRLQYDHGVAVPGEPCPTLKAGGNHDASGKQGGGCPPMLQVWGGGRNHPADADGNYQRDERVTNEPSTTIAVASGNALPELRVYGAGWHDVSPKTDRDITEQNDTLHPVTETCGTIGAGEGKGGKASHFLVSPDPFGPGPWKLRNGVWIRRLSVRECQRLQSMPDDWRWPEGFTKTNGYRCVGNGQACAMAMELGEAIRAVDPECTTAVSLFCGAGLGDAGFEGRVWRYEPEMAGAK